jgi:hypothetical protein
VTSKVIEVRKVTVDRLEREGMRANFRAAGDHVRHGSEVIERLIESAGLAVVCAEYSLKSSAVQILDDVGSRRGDPPRRHLLPPET